MRRTPDQAIDALRSQVRSWARREARPDLRVFVYPPEWEAAMLPRLAQFALTSAADGEPVELVDLGKGFLDEVTLKEGLVERLRALGRDDLLNDLGWIAATYLKRLIRSQLPPTTVCRILVNSGSLGTFTSYSAVANELGGGATEPSIPATVLAFPGEGDDRSLNLLGLRVDTNYRVPRV
jgi:hypothetical protein